MLITNCGCLGPCFDGPNAVVYPDGVWYAGLVPGDAAGLADHLASGHVLAAKLSHRPGLEAFEAPETPETEDVPADESDAETAAETAETASESASDAHDAGSAAVRDRDHSAGKPGRR